MKINVLPGEVYNRISAGEVVENPRSVVKELVENAVDAGASAISVYIEDGGIKSVTVIDNGIGIERSEVETAFLPHATSKIKTAEDLETLSTLGFRGEALPSIAAVAEVTMITRFKDDKDATKIIVKGGQVLEKSVSQIECGTNVEVRNLFYNTPARFKFLKSIKSEEAAVTSVMAGFILANPQVNFKYYVDGNLKYESVENTLFSAACTVFSEDFAAKCAEISLSDNSVKISGYTSLPELSRGNKGMQYLIINGRIVSDSAISAVVQNAYENRLMTRMFPMFVIDIIMPFDAVDVNVHPNKLEVRLANPRLIHGLIYKAVKNALEKADEEKTVELLKSFAPITTPSRTEQRVVENKITTPTSTQKSIRTEDIKSKPTVTETVKPFVSKYSDVTIDFDDFKRTGSTSRLRSSYNDIDTVAADKTETKTQSDSQLRLLNKEAAAEISYTVLGQIFDTYILAESGDELLIIDQHAAHERILFNKLTDAFSKEAIGRQILLFPISFTPDSPQEYDFLVSELKTLDEVGFDLKDNGDGTIFISAIPEIMTGMNIERIMTEFCSDYKSGKENVKTIVKDKLARAACRAAIKGGDKLSGEATSYFLEYYIKEGVPLQCPHGRPTVVKMSKKDFEKMFKRII